MKKILILGNSHVGALKMGCEKLNYSENFLIQFAALPGNFSQMISLKNNELFLTENLNKKFGGLNKNLEFPIDIRNFDFIALVFFPSPLKFLNAKNYYSKNLLKNVINELHFAGERFKRNKKLFLQLKEIIPSKLILIPTPVPIKKTIKRDSFSNTSLSSKYLLKQISLVRLICDEFWEEDNKVSILLPPKNLLENNQLNTKEKYVRGGFGWDGIEHERENDLSHMNADYGQEIILTLINKLN